MHFSFKVVIINHVHNSCPFDWIYCYWSPLMKLKKNIIGNILNERRNGTTPASYRCSQSRSDWRRHDWCIRLVTFWNCYCSKGTQHSSCVMLSLQTNPGSFLVAKYPVFHSFRTWLITGGITRWDTCTCVPPQQKLMKLGVLCFSSQKAQHNYMYMFFVGSFHYSCCIKHHAGIL